MMITGDGADGCARDGARDGGRDGPGCSRPANLFPSRNNPERWHGCFSAGETEARSVAVTCPRLSSIERVGTGDSV